MTETKDEFTEEHLAAAQELKKVACGKFWDSLRTFMIDAPPVPEELYLRLAKALGISEERALEMRDFAKIIKPWDELTEEQKSIFTDSDEMTQVGQTIMRGMRRTLHPESFSEEKDDLIETAGLLVAGKADITVIDLSDFLK